ncbi:MAG: glutaredoxin domain-containing protein [Burkholderiaceae bacterium]
MIEDAPTPRKMHPMPELHSPDRTFQLTGLCMGLMLLISPAHALYKVVGPDGKVSYTDRPPIASNDKISTVKPNGVTTALDDPTTSLPAALRQVAIKFPVVLYVTTPDCEPCNAGRSFLRQRGIPYAERSVTTTEDSEAFKRIAGANDVPALTIGSQVLRGFSASEWAQYLDAAGYPPTSTLPSGYKQAEATPLVAPRTVTQAPAARPVATPAPATVQPTPAAPANPTGIKF